MTDTGFRVYSATKTMSTGDASPNEPPWLRESPVASPADPEKPQSASVLINEKVQPSWLSSASNIEEGGEPSTARKPKKKELVEDATFCCCPRDPVLNWFRMFHLLCLLLGLASAAVNVYILTSHFIQLIDIVLHSYAIVFSLLIVIIEADWRYVVSRIRLMDIWVWRGCFYALVGFMTRKGLYDDYYPCLILFISVEDEAVDVMSLNLTPINVIGFMQIFFGVLYMCMVILPFLTVFY